MNEQRKRFRADISNSSLESILHRKKQRRKTDSHYQQQPAAPVEPEDPAVILAKSICRDRVPPRQPKKRPPKEIAKPEHWIKPPVEAKLSREVIYAQEKDNINIQIAKQQNWSRAARHLSLANNQQNSQAEDSGSGNPEDEDEAAQLHKMSTARLHRNNRSRDFLQSFFARAGEIQAEKRKHKVPSFIEI